jgi:hypothetical protein
MVCSLTRFLVVMTLDQEFFEEPGEVVAFKRPGRKNRDKPN